MAGCRFLLQMSTSSLLVRTVGFTFKPQQGPSVAGTLYKASARLYKLVSFYSWSQLRTMSGSGKVSSNISDAQYWIKRWDDGEIGFHNNYIHPFLKKHTSVWSGGKSKIRIFFPLCGKALDMKWLADQGHTVIGVEASQKAVQDFFTEQNIPFTMQPVPVIDGTLFQSENGRLHLYCCDFFKFSKDVAGHMDAIWDRAALAAINKEDREKYVAVIKPLMGPGCQYMLVALQYDETQYGGPPHNLGTESIITLFGDDYSIEEIDDADGLEPRHVAMGIQSMREKLFCISHK